MEIVLQSYTCATLIRRLWFTQARKNDAVTMISHIDALSSFEILANMVSRCLIVSLSLVLQAGWCRVLRSPTQLNDLHRMAPSKANLLTMRMCLHKSEYTR